MNSFTAYANALVSLVGRFLDRLDRLRIEMLSASVVSRAEEETVCLLAVA